MADDSILNQIRNKRNRTTVPERFDELVPKFQQQQDNTAPLEPENLHSSKSGDTISALKSELEQYPLTKRHSAIVLEKDLDSQLTQFCKDQGITIETFLEAAWTEASTDNILREKITIEAKRRYDGRKRVGQLKRLITMLSNNDQK